MAHGSRRDGALAAGWLRAIAYRFRFPGGDGRAGARSGLGAVACLAGALLAAPPTQAGPTVVQADLVVDPTNFVANMLFPDKVGMKGVFAKYGQNPWQASGSFSYDTGTKFFGLDTGALGDSVGGITGGCTPDLGFGSACAYFGAKVSASGQAKAGVDYRFQTSGGSLDIRYPVQVTLELPYGPNATSVPNVGEFFTIGSSWSVQTSKLLDKPGTPASELAPMLASHGPSLEAFVDLVGRLRANIDAELCAGPCTGDPFPGFDKSGVKEIAAVNRNGDGQVRVFGQTATPGSPDELMGGIIKYYLNAPKLDTQGTLGADNKTLSATAGDKLIGLGLGIDELIASFLGLPPLSDSFGISIAGEHLGVGYNLLDATGWMDLLLKQKLGFIGAPVIDLEFSADVRVKHPDGSLSAPTKKVSFNAGDPIELASVSAQVIGVVPTIRLFAAASNKTDLELAASVSVSALGLDTPLGGIGPLFSDTATFPIGSMSVDDTSFLVDFESIVGGAFNMAFLPPEKWTPAAPDAIALTFWDKGQWGDPDAGGCAGLADCSFLPQSKVIGFYELADADPLLACLGLGRTGGCSPDELLALLESAVSRENFQRFHDRFFFTSPRLFGAEDYELFLGDLLALDEPVLDIRPGLSPEEIERSRAALQLAFGPQPFVIPPYPTPEPGSVALVALGLAGLFAARKHAAAARA